MAVEETAYETCPECGRDGKLSLKRNDSGLLYYCLRATCGFKGFVWNVGAVQARATGKRGAGVKTPSKAKPFMGRLEPLRAGQRAWFMDRFGIDAASIAHHGVRWAPEKGAYAFPVHNPAGYTRGYMLRYYDGTKPKTVAYPGSDAPWQAWYSFERPVVRPDTVLVVEDQVSAMKAASLVPTVALLGTSLSTAGALEIADTHPSRVLIALDYDATDQAFRLASVYSLLFRQVKVRPLQRDVKDMRYADIEGLIA